MQLILKKHCIFCTYILSSREEKLRSLTTQRIAILMTFNNNPVLISGEPPFQGRECCKVSALNAFNERILGSIYGSVPAWLGKAVQMLNCIKSLESSRALANKCINYSFLLLWRRKGNTCLGPVWGRQDEALSHRPEQTSHDWLVALWEFYTQ